MKRVFSNISEEKYAAIGRQIEQRLGQKLAGHEGVIEAHGFQAGYRYDPAAQTLEVNLLKRPWMVPEWLIERKVDEWFAGPGASVL